METIKIGNEKLLCHDFRGRVMPAPGEHGCIIRYQPKESQEPVNF